MKEVTIVTHNSNFHTDDVFAVAAIMLVIEQSEFEGVRGAPVKVIRTREDKLMKQADFVVDVGGKYNEEENRFDHHQVEGSGQRENGIPYASFGLVWKKYGEMLTGSQEAANVVDRKLVCPIDAHDNGFKIADSRIEGVEPYLIEDFIFSFYPTWLENESDWDGLFLDLVFVAKALIKREIVIAHARDEAKKHITEAYEKMTDKRIIILESYFPWRTISREFPETLYVVYPERVNGNWHVGAVQAGKGMSFTNRKDLPKEWGGLRDKELAKVSGVEDALFCHTKLFLAVAKTRSGAVALAKKALEA